MSLFSFSFDRCDVLSFKFAILDKRDDAAVASRPLAVLIGREHLLHFVQLLPLEGHHALLLQVQAYAHLAQESLTHTAPLVVKLDILLPLEVVIVGRLVLVQIEQIVGEVARRLKVERVYERRLGHELLVVAATQHHWHHVVLERVEELLGYVVLAERVLEGQVEFRLSGDHVTTSRVGELLLQQALSAALAVDVHGVGGRVTDGREGLV